MLSLHRMKPYKIETFVTWETVNDSRMPDMLADVGAKMICEWRPKVLGAIALRCQSCVSAATFR